MEKTNVYIPGAVLRSTPAIQTNATQHTLHSKNAMTATPGNNYAWFTPQYKNVSNEALIANKGYENHPELGMLFAETPCDNCYELISKRTEISKTFIKEGTGGRDIMQQTSSAPMHYRDAQGNWKTIKTKLRPDNDRRGMYAANEQPCPVSINTNNVNSFSSLGKAGESFQFNHNLELVYVKPDGSELSLGTATWTNYTAGDDGVYVKNAWPGVDIEMFAFWGGIKTNFLINHAFPEYANGKLLVRDHLRMENGLSLSIPDEIQSKLIPTVQTKYTGKLSVKNNSGAEVYFISDATVSEKNNVAATFQQLEYYINGNILDIALPGNFLDRPASSYPVIIDPLVSTATTTPIPPAPGGSNYSTTFAARTGCHTLNPATTPANVTVTDIQFANQYTARNGAVMNDAGVEFFLGTCRSPGAATGFAGLWWYCNPVIPAAGTCTAAGGATYSMWSDFSACVSPPQCAPYNLNIDMYVYQQYATTAACATTYIYMSQPLTITVFGHTVEIVGGAAGVTATPATICAGASSTLSVSGTYGVPPYTWSWTPGGMTGTPVVVSPTVTTIYTTTVTDACGITASAGRVVTVNPVAPLTGVTTVCVGNTTTLSNGGIAGAWSSGTPAVATVVAATGVVTGVAAGTSVIRFTTTAGGCISTITVTVTPVPVAITGTTTLCVGSTTTLSDVTLGGTWTSSNTGVATIGLNTGIVSGVAPGTSVITYSLGGACIRTTTVTVNLLAPITGTLTVCAGGTITLSDAAGAGTWSSSNTAVATITLATGVVTGVAPGITTIRFTTPTGCSTTTTVTVNALSPITGNMIICVGGTTTLSDAAGAGTWSSSNTTVATINLTTGVVSGVSAGTTTIRFTTNAGCNTTATVTVNGLYPITGPARVCQGNTITLNNAGVGGTWSSGTTTVATIGLGTGVVSGVLPGTTVITYITPGNCAVTTTMTVDPLPAAITGVTNVCKGLTTYLSDATAGGTWSSGTTTVATIGLGTGIVAGVLPGTTVITYTSPLGCITTIPLTVNPLPTPITGNTSICLNATSTLNSTPAGGTWSSGNISVATVDVTLGVVTGVSVGTANITYTLPTGCITATPVTINPLPAAPIITNLDYCQNQLQIPALTAVGTGLLWYTTLTGGVGSNTAPTPSTTLPGVTTWYVSQTNANNCESGRTPLQVTVHPRPPKPFIAATRPHDCQFDTIGLYYAGPSFAGATFDWSVPSYASIASGTSSSQNIEVKFDTTIGNNYVILTVGDGYAACTVTDTLPVIVYLASPIARFYMKPDACIGDSIPIALSYIGLGVTDYTWNFDGATIITASSNHGGPYEVMWLTEGIHTVSLSVISNKDCPSRIVKDTIDIHPLPDAKIISVTKLNSKGNDICIGDSVQLDVLNYSYTNNYVWAPDHFFKQNNSGKIVGRIELAGPVTVTVTDPFGCKASDQYIIDAQPCCIVTFPNAFTPNGDGHNDIFRPITAGNHTIHVFRIVNRWGQTVYESVNERAAWDGTLGGVPQDIGVYYYYLKYDCGGKTMEEKGDVNLIR